ncbi:WD40 repeat domain-containing protein [Streptomyces sp. NBC_01304]|uniref:WD40 repeat domain-containing protein n=1 Tax=Streptomyces sp. NBC_01304 TaxID=2903818 RepID=UPI002E1383D6|nr:WD40 repeat domain-containing protein [Streptomyces sp. NBC_01304]
MTSADAPAADRLFQRLRHVVPRDGADRPLWHLADPYLLRHLARHAVDAGSLDSLLAEPGFLLHAEPEAIGAVLHEARSTQARLSAAVYRHSATLHGAPAERERSQLLTLAAERLGHRELRGELPADRDWTVRWATGQQVSTALLRSVPLGPLRVRTVAALEDPDGRPVAVALGTNGSVTLWDLATGAPLRERPGRNDDATALAMAGPWAVIGTAGGALWRWDVHRGGRPDRLGGHEGEITHVAVLPWEGDALVVSVGADGTMLVQLLAHRAPPRQLPGQVHRLGALTAFGHDGLAYAMTCTLDGAITVHDLRTGDIRSTARSRGGPIRSVVAVAEAEGEADRPLAVVGSADGSASVWDPFLGRLLGALPGSGGGSPALAAPGVRGQALAAAGGADGQVRVWDVSSGRLRQVLTGHTSAVRGISALHIRGTGHLVTGGDDGTLRLWDLAAPGPRKEPSGHTGQVRAVAACPASDRAVSASDDATVRVWELSTGRVTATLTGHTDWVRSVALTRLDGRACAVSGGDDGTVRLWDLADGSTVRVLSEATGGVRRVVVAPVGGRPCAVAGCADGTIRLWDLATGVLLSGISPGAGAIWDVAVVAAGDRAQVIGTHLDGSAQVHDLVLADTGHSRRSRRSRRLPVRGWPRVVATLSWQGRPLAAVGCHDGTVQVWDLASGEATHLLSGHTPLVHTLSATDVGGRPLLVTGDDRALRVWDLTDGTCLTTHALPEAAYALDVLPDGTVLVGMGREVAVLDISPLLRRL